MPFVSYLISEFCHFFRLVLFLVFLFLGCVLGVSSGIERENGFVWRVFLLSAHGGARELILKKQVRTIDYTYSYELLSCWSFYSVVKKYLATVQETAKSSAWNHIFKFRRRGRHGRSSRKLLPLCHPHRSAQRSLYLPCQITNYRKSSELEQNDGISYRKN